MRQGWEEKMLKEIGIAQTGTTPKTADEDNYGDFIPFIKPADIDIFNDGEIRYDNDGLSEKGLQSGRKMAEGSILMVCIGATIGKVGFVDRDVSCNQQVNSLTVKKGFSPKFFYYALSTSSFYEQVMKNAAQATLPIINKGKWECLTVKYPISLPEQQRIVAILDEAFAAIAKAKANTEQNLKNAKELFDSYLQSVFENKGERWEEKTLGEIATVIGGYSFKSGVFKADGKYQVIRMGNVRPGLIRENESPVFMKNLDDKVLKKALLLPNDVIITQTGTKNKRDYGFTVIIEKENYLLNQRISAIRFSKNYLPKFFLYFSWTNHFKDQYFANETGTVGQGNVGIGAITNAIVPLLSLKDQQAIVQKLDALSAQTKKLEAIYQQHLNDLEELKKSILQKAFNGELNTEKSRRDAMIIAMQNVGNTNPEGVK